MSSRIEFNIDPKNLKRASKVPDQMIGSYMDQIITELHMRVDQWRFHDAPPGDVDTCLQALLALWIEAGIRGFA